ncbi:C40 family peptidase [Mucilaginibacter sp. UR6-11]|uniref:C40 family peptidase n=1 Tax=Mucilaginibacter sp. UR6-11 TaxID=1435644 RepID=UPI001E4BB931|nr:C40 family peptidase [Mucilaginibacter sp. UR6-11]MCC8423641.1 C40 family peptidase [Mucilaginibacter sp. UR6-11]
MRFNIGGYIVLLSFLSCNSSGESSSNAGIAGNPYNKIIGYPKADSAGYITKISTGKTNPADLVIFAKSLIGVPYKYGSTDPTQGFDCSGFITHVFNHFGILVPRSSTDFTIIHRGVKLQDTRPGDLILFTGTDSTIRKVGHMGIIISSPGQEVKFIHSTSGKAYGVTETPLNKYYMGRYIKTIRVFPQNDK